jgi:hypothetical protein
MIMKKCPYCAEEIQTAAIKCKHCGEFLDDSNRPRPAAARGKWYFRTSFIVFAVFLVGPLALPLIWWRPRTTMAWKIGLTIGIGLLSWLFFQATLESVRVFREYYQLLESGGL